MLGQSQKQKESWGGPPPPPPTLFLFYVLDYLQNHNTYENKQ